MQIQDPQQLQKKGFSKIPMVEDAKAIQGNNILKEDGTLWQWTPDLTLTQLNIDAPIVPNDTFFQGDQLGITQEGNFGSGVIPLQAGRMASKHTSKCPYSLTKSIARRKLALLKNP